MSVLIAIKSEIDSRALLYPLMKCLSPLGRILVITSNKQVSRIIDGDFEGDLKNFHILVDLYGATDEILEDSNISVDEYNFVIYDNVGVVEYDKLIIPIGPVVSESFEQEMYFLGEDRNTYIIRFGKEYKAKERRVKSNKSKEEILIEKEKKKEEAIQRKKELKEKKMKSNGNNISELSDDEIYEAAKSKFNIEKEDVAAKLKKLPNIKFPMFEEFESFESLKTFPNVDRNLIKYLYEIFKEYIGIKEPNYIREVSKCV